MVAGGTAYLTFMSSGLYDQTLEESGMRRGDVWQSLGKKRKGRINGGGIQKKVSEVGRHIKESYNNSKAQLS